MKITWIGLGNMGLPMASNLSRHTAKTGDDLVVFDVNRETRGAAAASGLTTGANVDVAADGADVLFTMLPNGTIVNDVLSRVQNRLAPEGIIVDCSTIASSDVEALHAKAQESGLRFLDAPVSGGTAGAIGATLTFMVGGSEPDINIVRPLLNAMGARLFHAGSVGRGQDAKIVNNLMLAINMQSVVEAALLADRLGLSHQTLIDIASESSGDSWVLRNYYPVSGVLPGAPASRDFEGGFATTLMLKDLGLARAAATDSGLELPAGALVQKRLLERLESAAHKDFSILVREEHELSKVGAR